MKDDHKAKSRGHFAIVACVLVLLPVAYVLSIGPMEWLVAHTYVSEDAWCSNELYAPVDWLADQSDSLADVLDSYIGLWVP